jgi:hypothetical protein
MTGSLGVVVFSTAISSKANKAGSRIALANGKRRFMTNFQLWVRIGNWYWESL